MRHTLLALAACLGVLGCTAGTALADDYCPDRPGLDTPPCTMASGHVSVETSLADWTHTSDDTAVADTLLLGDLALRVGLGPRTEARLAWSPYGRVTVRDRSTGQKSVSSGSGDVTLGLKHNVLDPAGDRLSIALLPSITLPTGGDALGAGTWSASLQMPMSLPAGKGLSLLLTPEIDAAANSSGHGRHFAFGTAGGLGFSPASGVNLAVEGLVMRDEDPDGASTEALAGLSAGWMIAPNLQVDAGAEFALNRSSPDRRLYVGLSRRF